MALNIMAELTAAGSTLSRDDFYDLVMEQRALSFPNWTEDELACHPGDALRFCETVRQKVAAPVQDHVIMHALMNARKRSMPSDSVAARPSTQKKSLQELLGLIKTDGPPPNDEECRRLLEEELLKKYGGS
jgi:hypothetical protein